MTATLKLSLQAGTTASSSPLTLTATAWNGLLRGGKKPGGALGNWSLTGPLAKTVNGVATRVPAGGRGDRGYRGHLQIHDLVSRQQEVEHGSCHDPHERAVGRGCGHRRQGD